MSSVTTTFAQGAIQVKNEITKWVNTLGNVSNIDIDGETSFSEIVRYCLHDPITFMKSTTQDISEVVVIQLSKYEEMKTVVDKVAVLYGQGIQFLDKLYTRILNLEDKVYVLQTKTKEIGDGLRLPMLGVIAGTAALSLGVVGAVRSLVEKRDLKDGNQQRRQELTRNFFGSAALGSLGAVVLGLSVFKVEQVRAFALQLANS